MTGRKALLGLLAALSFAACSGSKSSSDGGGGTSGTGCQVVECLRPYECVRMCGGPIVRSSCCPCASL
jgi:hypothetical protein